ncbi:MAG: hypothetical protein AAF821_03860 [Cyanobacteria bacterium P01_D01_bin.156]
MDARAVVIGMLAMVAGCGPRQPDIPNTVEAIARECYVELLTPERTPELEPAKAMEDGTFLILWSMAEADERGSCNVDGRGRVLLLTSNGDPNSLDSSTPQEGP